MWKISSKDLKDFKKYSSIHAAYRALHAVVITKLEFHKQSSTQHDRWPGEERRLKLCSYDGIIRKWKTVVYFQWKGNVFWVLAEMDGSLLSRRVIFGIPHIIQKVRDKIGWKVSAHRGETEMHHWPRLYFAGSSMTPPNKILKMEQSMQTWSKWLPSTSPLSVRSHWRIFTFGAREFSRIDTRFQIVCKNL